MKIIDLGRPEKSTAVALGIFDGIHLGHRAVLKKALEQKEYAPAVFTFSGMEQKHGEPLLKIIPESQKFLMLDRMGFEYLYSPRFTDFCDMSAEDFCKDILAGKLNAGIVVCGENFVFGRNTKGNTDTLKKYGKTYGFGVIVISPVEYDGQVVSSTRIRKAITDGNMKLAKELLGCEYSVEREVISGNRIGRTIDFPTANQRLEESQIIPRFGVYSSETEINGLIYESITNIGVKPTIDIETPAPLAETHILGYHGNLYGTKIRVMLKDFIRAEKKFSSVQQLKEQIAIDIKSR